MEWFKPEETTEHISGHSTTVLGLVGSNGEITVYDNNDKPTGATSSVIGVHDAAYWLATNPSGITIFRLDPDQQYLIQGSSLSEHIQGSVYNDLIQPNGGADVIAPGPGSDEIQGTTAELDGITVTAFDLGDSFDFSNLAPQGTAATYNGGALHVMHNFEEVAAITLPQPTAGLGFTATPDGNGGTSIALAASGSDPLGQVIGTLEFLAAKLLPPSDIALLQNVVEPIFEFFEFPTSDRPELPPAVTENADAYHLLNLLLRDAFDLAPDQANAIMSFTFTDPRMVALAGWSHDLDNATPAPYRTTPAALTSAQARASAAVAPHVPTCRAGHRNNHLLSLLLHDAFAIASIRRTRS